MLRTSVAAAAFSAALAGSAALAQNALINVNLEDIRVDIATNLNLDVENVPVNILLPVAVAANVCGVDVNLLLAQTVGDDEPSCTATNMIIASQVVNTTINAGGEAEAAEAEEAPVEELLQDMVNPDGQ